MLRRRASSAIAILAFFIAGCGSPSASPDRPITLAATTTIEDTGLLEALLEAFHESHRDIRVRAMTGGTGEMLELARRGDVDVVLSHDPAAEEEFVREGHGAERRDLMENDFIIVGPAADPAGIRGMRDAPAALRRIAEAGAIFISRGDESGTHRAERRLWTLAGLEPIAGNGSKDRWYVEAGVGMAEALRLASERRAYILTDRATFLVLGESIALDLRVEGDPRMLNRYGVVRVADSPNPEGARAFVEWLTSAAGQRVVGAFGRDRHGAPLFTPRAETRGPRIGWVPNLETTE